MMKAPVSALIVLAAAGANIALAQVQPNEPTKKEIAEAYRSKGGLLRTKEIRGWKLHFKRSGQRRTPGVITLKYNAVAKKNESCAEYAITDTMPSPPSNPQIKPILVVDLLGVKACR